ncbi:MAG: metallophosphoesterase, partial [Pseudomonadota bacterium]
MTRFLHLTDLHITPEGDTLPALDRALDIARRIDPAPEFIVVSGDLTDRGDAESYAILATRMAGLDVPVIYALGNHDHRAAFHSAFPGHPGASDGPLDHDHVIAGLHVIVLDSSVPGRTSGG